MFHAAAESICKRCVCLTCTVVADNLLLCLTCTVVVDNLLLLLENHTHVRTGFLHKILTANGKEHTHARARARAHRMDESMSELTLFYDGSGIDTGSFYIQPSPTT